MPIEVCGGVAKYRISRPQFTDNRLAVNLQHKRYTFLSTNVVIRDVNMPAYNNPGFMQRVRRANPTYARIKSSSLRSLIAVLNDPNGMLGQVRFELNALRNKADGSYRTKFNKYREALCFLQHTYPVPAGVRVPIGGPNTTEAVHFQQTAMPHNFNAWVAPDPQAEAARYEARVRGLAPPPVHVTDRLVSNNIQGLGMTVEEYIYNTPGAKGIVLIHLGGFQAPMSNLFDGWSQLVHMQSVLRAANVMNHNICVLHMGNNPPVCGQLTAEINLFGNRVVVHENGHHHMGNRHQAFSDFVANNGTMVVMGFDANVCVRANLFGSEEYYVDPNNVANTHATVPPILSQAPVVTSRALLVSAGPIQPVQHQGEYGALLGR